MENLKEKNLNFIKGLHPSKPEAFFENLFSQYEKAYFESLAEMAKDAKERLAHPEVAPIMKGKFIMNFEKVHADVCERTDAKEILKKYNNL